MSGQIRIYLLGGLRVTSGERTIERFRTRKTASLLGYLAYHLPGAVPREILVDRFWPDAPVEKARISLNTALSSLRQQLGSFATLPEPFLLADRNAVRLNPGLVWTDVEAFKRSASKALAPPHSASDLREALDLYKGDLLEGHYDDWISLKAVELSELADALRAREARSDSPIAKPRDEEDSPAPTGNLPRVSNRFVGRERDLARLRDLSESFPLVTMVGMGGIGKTRLAIEYGKQLATAGDQCWLIGFAAASSGVSIAEEILRQLGASVNASVDPVEQLSLRFRDQSPTLILDNLEHLDSVQQDLPAIVQQCRSTKIIATSRIRLNLENEEVFNLEPLATPADGENFDVLQSNPSVALFISRASSAAPGFALGRRNAEDVCHLCQLLGGISLAIELAAARVQVYGPREMVEQMERPLEFLVSRLKDRSERHRSLRSAIDWSFRLLSNDARSFFPALCVERGGWTLTTLQDVFPDIELPSILQELMDASLVESSHTAGRSRFQIHAVLREFGLELLSGSEQGVLRERLLHHFMSMVAVENPSSLGAKLKDWLDSVEEEIENIRDALTWAWDSGRDAEAAQLSVHLAAFWYRRGQRPEGSRWFERAQLSDKLPEPLRASVLRFAGMFAKYRGEFQLSRERLEQAADLLGRLGDDVQRAAVLNVLAGTLERLREFGEAERCFLESYEVSRSHGDPRMGLPLMNLAIMAEKSTQHARAVELYRRALDVGREHNDPFLTAYVLTNLAFAYIRSGALDDAAQRIEQATNLNEQLGNRSILGYALQAAGMLAYRQGDHDTAEKRLLEARSTFHTGGDAEGTAQVEVLEARLALKRGDTAKAEELLLRSREAAIQLMENRMRAETAGLLGYLNLGSRADRAAPWLREMLELLENDPQSIELYDGFVMISELADPACASDLISTAREFYCSTQTDPDPLIADLLSRHQGVNEKSSGLAEALVAARQTLR